MTGFKLKNKYVLIYQVNYIEFYSYLVNFTAEEYFLIGLKNAFTLWVYISVKMKHEFVSVNISWTILVGILTLIIPWFISTLGTLRMVFLMFNNNGL